MLLPGNERNQIHPALERILPTVVRPARYTGNEWNSIVKEWPGRLHVALVYPDVYEEGVCDPLMQSVYAILNSDDGVLCERAFLPWADMDEAMRQAGVLLYALESKRPLAEFDLVLVMRPGELYAPAVLTALDLAGLGRPPAAHPFIVAIGPSTANPEPLADFFDAFIIGEVDAQAVREVSEALHSAQPTLRAGMYLPRRDGAAHAVTARRSRTVPPLVTRPIVPFVEAKRERGVVELARPPLYSWSGESWRERPLDEILAAVETLLAATGYDHIQLTGPHSQLSEIVDRLSTRYSGAHVHISLDTPANTPEIVDLADRLPHITRGALTIDIATGSESDVLAAARLAFQRGWHVLRLNASLGAPGETWAEVERLVSISRCIRDIGREEINGQAQVHVHATPYIPRAHSPQQRAGLLVGEEWDRRLALLSKGIRGPGLRLQWRGLETRLVEAALARGDRRLSAVIEAAWRGGMRRPEDAQNAAAWQAAFEKCGLDMASDAARERPAHELLPWDSISPA